MFAVIDEMTDEFKKMWAEFDMMRRKIAHYESENRSSSTTSFLQRRTQKNPQAARGEFAGGPGEKIVRKGGADNGSSSGDYNDNSNGGL